MNLFPDIPVGGHAIVFDLETTGLPHMRGFNMWFPPSRLDAYDASRMVELAYVKVDRTEEGYTLSAPTSYLFRPEGWTIENAEFHGITADMAHTDGIPFRSIALDLKSTLEQATCIISHNIHFDRNILLSEFFRLGMTVAPVPHYCTMMMGWYRFDMRKYPTLLELLRAVQLPPTVPRHRAAPDALDCARAFVAMLHPPPQL